MDNREKRSGEIGEKVMSRWLKELPPGFIVINNVLLDTTGLRRKRRGFKSSTQIDHLVISQYGIIVIETKNHGGYIVGGAFDKYWIQASRMGVNKFYNPLMQNQKHAEYISRIFNIMPDAIFTAVVFTSNNCDISGVSRFVYNPVSLISKVKSMVYANRRIFTQDEVEYIARCIQKKRKYGAENEKKHINFVKKAERIGRYGY